MISNHLKSDFEAPLPILLKFACNRLHLSNIVSAWCKEDGFCLGRKALEEKSNEITAIPDLLENLQIKGQIITLDTMGTQKEIAKKIHSKRADYVLAVKGNQRTLHEEIGEYFAEDAFCKKIKEGGDYKRNREKSYEQLEIREYYSERQEDIGV